MAIDAFEIRTKATSKRKQQANGLCGSCLHLVRHFDRLRKFPAARCGDLWEAPGHAETHDVTAVVGRIAFSGGRSQQPLWKHPRAAAINSEAIALAVLHLGVARRGLVRASICGGRRVRVVVTVLGPLPNVPCHVVKAECVRRLCAHRMCLATVAKKTIHFFAPGVGIEPGVGRSAASSSPQ